MEAGFHQRAIRLVARGRVDAAAIATHGEIPERPVAHRVAARRSADDNRPRLSQALKACRKVRRLPNQSMLPQSAPATGVTHDHQTSGDPNPNRPDLPHYGAGETVCKPLLAAVANAIYDATGVRLRRVPFRPARVLAALKGTNEKA